MADEHGRHPPTLPTWDTGTARSDVATRTGDRNTTDRYSSGPGAADLILHRQVEKAKTVSVTVIEKIAVCAWKMKRRDKMLHNN